MNCLNCGMEISNGESVCRRCGTPISKPFLSKKAERILTIAAFVLGGCALAAGIGAGILRLSVKKMQKEIKQQETTMQLQQNSDGSASSLEKTDSWNNSSGEKKNNVKNITLTADMVREAYPFSGGYAIVYGQDQLFYIIDTDGNVTGTFRDFIDQTGTLSIDGAAHFYNGYAVIHSERKGQILIDSGGEIILDGSDVTIADSSALEYGCLAVRKSGGTDCAYDVDSRKVIELPQGLVLGESVGGGWYNGTDASGSLYAVNLQTGDAIDLLRDAVIKEAADTIAKAGQSVQTALGWADDTLTAQVFYTDLDMNTGSETGVGITAYLDTAAGKFVEISDLPQRIIAAAENEIILQYDAGFSEYLNEPYAGLLTVWHKDTDKADETDVSLGDRIQCVGWYDGKFMIRTAKSEGDSAVTLMDKDGKFLFEPVKGMFWTLCGHHALISGNAMLAGTNSISTYIVNLDTYEVQSFNSTSVFTEYTPDRVISADPECKEYPIWLYPSNGSKFDCYDLMTGKPLPERDVIKSGSHFPDCVDGILLLDKVYYGKNGKLLKEQGE